MSNYRFSSKDEKDVFSSKLHAAILNCQFKMVKILIEGGAPIDLKNHHGHTPIMTATRALGSKDNNKQQDEMNKIIDLLMTYGANPFEVDDEGDTCFVFFKLHQHKLSNENIYLSDESSDELEYQRSLTRLSEHF